MSVTVWLKDEGARLPFEKETLSGVSAHRRSLIQFTITAK